MKTQRNEHQPGRSMLSNPISQGLLIGAGIVALGAGAAGVGYAVRRRNLKKRGELPPAPVDEQQATDGIWSEVWNPLRLRTDVVDDIAQPVQMRTDQAQPDPAFLEAPDLTVELPSGEPRKMLYALFGIPDEGHMTLDDGSGAAAMQVATQGKAIGSLMVPLMPDAIKAAYEWSLEDLSTHPGDWNAQQDTAVRRILANMVPGIDWSRGLEPFAYGSPASQVWYGVQTIGAVASASMQNKAQQHAPQLAQSMQNNPRRYRSHRPRDPRHPRYR